MMYKIPNVSIKCFVVKNKFLEIIFSVVIQQEKNKNTLISSERRVVIVKFKAWFLA